MVKKKIINFLRRVIEFLSHTNKDEVFNENINNPWHLYRDYIKIHPTAIIDPAATVKFFNPPLPPEICLEIGEGSHIFSTFNMLRPQSKIRIGKNCQIGAVNFVCAESIEVGDDVLMAWGITVIDTDSHSLYWSYRQKDVKQCYEDYIEDRSNFIKNKDWTNVKCKKIYIGNRTWIGFNASILKGVQIRDESIVGAGSVVINNVPEMSIVMGNPANVIKKLVKNEI